MDGRLSCLHIMDNQVSLGFGVQKYTNALDCPILLYGFLETAYPGRTKKSDLENQGKK